MHGKEPAGPMSLHLRWGYLHFHFSSQNRIMEDLQYSGEEATNTENL